MSSKIKSRKVSFDLKRFAGIKRDYTKEDVEKLSPKSNVSIVRHLETIKIN